MSDLGAAFWYVFGVTAGFIAGYLLGSLVTLWGVERVVEQRLAEFNRRQAKPTNGRKR